MEKPCKCGNPNVVIKPDGINELDPCFYKVKKLIEMFRLKSHDV